MQRSRALRGAGLLALGTGVLLACAGAASPPADPASPPASPPTSRKMELTTLAQMAAPGQAGGAIREVLRDDASYRRRWADLAAGSALAKDPPAVDFQKRMVVVAALATQSCVAKVTIQRIVEEGAGLRVELLEQFPGPHCRCIVASRPFHVVAVDRHDRNGPVEFHAKRGPDTC